MGGNKYAATQYPSFHPNMSKNCKSNSLLSSDNSHRGGGDRERGAPPLRVPLGGLQGVRQGVQLPQVARESRAQAWRQVRLPLHCGGMQDEIQLSGQYYNFVRNTNILTWMKYFVFDNSPH